jgi:hypothetical protein
VCLIAYYRGNVYRMWLLVKAGCGAVATDIAGGNALTHVALSGVVGWVHAALTPAGWCEQESKDCEGSTAFLISTAFLFACCNFSVESIKTL